MFFLVREGEVEIVFSSKGYAFEIEIEKRKAMRLYSMRLLILLLR